MLPRFTTYQSKSVLCLGQAKFTLALEVWFFLSLFVLFFEQIHHLWHPCTPGQFKDCGQVTGATLWVDTQRKSLGCSARSGKHRSCYKRSYTIAYVTVRIERLENHFYTALVAWAQCMRHYNFLSASSSSFRIVNDPDRKKSACALLTHN